MNELLPIFTAALILAGISELVSVSDYRYGGYKKKDIFFYSIMAIMLAVFVGLRTTYNDTSAYTHAYELMPKNFRGIDWTLGSNFGFVVVNRCLKILGFSEQSFLMFFAVITVCIYLWFIRKYTEHIWLSVFLFLVTECYTFPMAAIKQCVAIAICMIATDFAIRKKWGRFIFFVLLASTFHPYALMYFIVPFLSFSPWSIYTYVMLAVFVSLGFGLESLLGTVVDITTMLGEEFTQKTFIGDGVNVFRLLVVWVPVLLSFCAKKYLCKSKDRETNILINVTILRSGIMFIALFGTANYFARLSNYFCLFQIITLPWVLKFYDKRSRLFINVFMIACYLVYFYYSQGILYGGFDSLFKRITLIEYINSLQ